MTESNSKAKNDTRHAHSRLAQPRSRLIRRHEGDYVADDEAVRRMMAERVEGSRNERVLKGFDLGDLDMDTVAAYRNRFAAARPGHV